MFMIECHQKNFDEPESEQDLFISLGEYFWFSLFDNKYKNNGDADGGRLSLMIETCKMIVLLKRGNRRSGNKMNEKRFKLEKKLFPVNKKVSTENWKGKEESQEEKDDHFMVYHNWKMVDLLVHW